MNTKKNFQFTLRIVTCGNLFIYHVFHCNNNNHVVIKVQKKKNINIKFFSHRSLWRSRQLILKVNFQVVNKMLII